MKRVLFFLDFANINRTAYDLQLEINYHHLLYYMGEGRQLIDAFAYVPIDPRNEHKYDDSIRQLQGGGYFVTTKIGTYAGDTYKCNFDVEMTIDILQIAHSVKPDIIVIGSGDGDFVPLIQTLRKMGIRVEIASYENNVSNNLILSASSFISLNEYNQEYLKFLNSQN